MSRELTINLQRMPRAELAKIERAVAAANKRWSDQGGKLTSWACAVCKATTITRQPAESDAGPRGYWDSLALCTACGRHNYVTVFPDGRTLVNGGPGKS